VTSPTGGLPAGFFEPWVLSHEGDARRARLRVRRPGAEETARFTAAHGAEIEMRPLNLEEIFPLLVNARRPAA
jgi:hypothetical protein